jgi:hypothetical protein
MGVKIDSEDILSMMDAFIASYMRQACEHRRKKDLGLYDRRTCSYEWLKESELIAEMNALAIKQVRNRIETRIENTQLKEDVNEHTATARDGCKVNEKHAGPG